MFEALFQKNASHIKPGLERIRSAYEFLDKPASKIPCVLIAGTNGKGTTAGFLWKMLDRAGVKVGLYTSPHLRHFSERFCISGQSVTDENVVAELEELQSRLPPELYAELSFFEVATLLAMLMFARAECAFGIFEVGLGGRWDATNITEPVISAIVSIGYDHQDYLGNSLQGIALEKAGVMRSGKPVFLGRGIDALEGGAVLKSLLSHAKEVGAVPLKFDEDYGFGTDEDIFLNFLQAPSSPELPDGVKSLPPFMRGNYCLAAAIYAYLGQDLTVLSYKSYDFHRLPPSLLARFQSLTLVNDPQKNIIVDVCHNIDGVKAFADSLDACNVGRPAVALVSILNDKKVNEMLDLLKGILNDIVLFKIDNSRSLNDTHLDSRHQDLPFFDSFAAAWKNLNDRAQPEATIAVCGSLMAVGEVLDYFSAEAAHQTHTYSLVGRNPLH